MQKLHIFGCWEVIRWGNNLKAKKEGPWFQVRRYIRKFVGGEMCCRVNLKCDENIRNCYSIIGLEGKSTLKIVDFSGRILAEVRSCFK